MLNQELVQALNVIKRTQEVTYMPEFSENPLDNLLKVEIDGRGINVDDLRRLVSVLDENKALYGTNYDLIVRFKSR